MPGNDVDQGVPIGGLGVGAPGHMAIWPNQHQGALVGRQEPRLASMNAAQGHAALRRRTLDPPGCGWVCAEPQQREATAE